MYCRAKNLLSGNTEYSVTLGMRQMPGICWYSNKGIDLSINSRWHRGLCIIRP